MKILAKKSKNFLIFQTISSIFNECEDMRFRILGLYVSFNSINLITLRSYSIGVFEAVMCLKVVS